MTTTKTLKIPILAVTGFLGAGKTTFVNHLLREPHGLKIG
ncbi:MAG: GTP-binding protein, partial [bacterium]